MSPSINQLSPEERPSKGTIFILHQKGAKILEERLKEDGEEAGWGLKGGEGLVYPGYENLDDKNLDDYNREERKLWLQRETDQDDGMLVSCEEDLFERRVVPSGSKERGG